MRYCAAHIQHMQKALIQMNLLLHNVVSDITGVTGMQIIKAILAGERNTQVLAGMRDRRCKNSIATIAKSLEGNYRPEHLFSLKQAVETFEFTFPDPVRTAAFFPVTRLGTFSFLNSSCSV